MRGRASNASAAKSHLMSQGMHLQPRFVKGFHRSVASRVIAESVCCRHVSRWRTRWLEVALSLFCCPTIGNREQDSHTEHMSGTPSSTPQHPQFNMDFCPGRAPSMRKMRLGIRSMPQPKCVDLTNAKNGLLVVAVELPGISGRAFSPIRWETGHGTRSLPGAMVFDGEGWIQSE